MPFRIAIRAATEDERDGLGALKLRSSLTWDDFADELRALREAREVPAEHLPFVFVAEIAGTTVGFATVLPRDGGPAELDDLFVEPAAWRRGIATQLLAEAERRAAALGAGALHVVAGSRAQAFYRKHGFRIIGEVVTRFEPAAAMLKVLDQTGCSGKQRPLPQPGPARR